MVPVCRLGLREPFFRPGDFAFSLSLVHKDSVAAMLCGLSILELCLVIAMKHIHDVREDQPFNFEMVYNGMWVRLSKVYSEVHFLLWHTVCPQHCIPLLHYAVFAVHLPEYKKFTQRSHSVEFFGKPVALKVSPLTAYSHNWWMQFFFFTAATIVEPL